MISVLLVDDEQLALTALEYKLKDFPQIEIKKSVLSPNFAMNDLRDIHIDVAILDIEMGTMSGLDLAELIHAEYPHIHIVFVSAHSEYAIQAFEVHSIDYILKPVTASRLTKTITRLETLITQSSNIPPVNNKIEIRCFHEFQVLHNGTVVAFKTANVKKLLAYFIMHQQVPIQPDVLIDTLWPNQDYKKSKINLHTCLSHLRKLLTSLGYDDCITFINKSYFFTWHGPSYDFMTFDQLFESPSGTSSEQLEQAIAIYVGALFELDNYDWAQSVRQRYSDAYLDYLEQLIQQVADTQPAKAITLLQRYLAYDPYRDDKALQCMKLLCASGQRTEAIKLYIKFTKLLHDELGIEPMGELTTFFDSLLARS